METAPKESTNEATPKPRKGRAPKPQQDPPLKSPAPKSKKNDAAVVIDQKHPLFQMFKDMQAQIDRLQKEAEPRTPLIFSAMRKVMEDIIPLAKTHEHPDQGFQFRRIDEICAQLQPVFSHHGIIFAPEVLEQVQQVERKVVTPEGTWVQIYTTIKTRWHIICTVDGSEWPTPVITMGEGMSDYQHSTAAAQTMAYKQVLTEIFCIPVYGAEDPEEVAGERSQATEAKTYYQQPEEKPTEAAPQPGLFDPPEAGATTAGQKKSRSKKEPDEPQVTAAGGATLETPVTTPITPGGQNIIKAAMKPRAVTEKTLFENFKVEGWSGITTAMMSEVMAWVNSQEKK